MSLQAEDFLRLTGAEFFTGVPDTVLQPLTDALMMQYGENPQKHVLAANEGNAMAIASGYHLATRKTALVYLQNSGEGNAVNPLLSLLSTQVYSIPALLVIGWRGATGEKDEPQHLSQGKVTLPFLELMQIPYFVIEKNISLQDVKQAMQEFKQVLAENRPCAFVVRKGALENPRAKYWNSYSLRREEAIDAVLDAMPEAFFVATTGKASRELYELRKRRRESHDHDFLMVGSMGHASSIALGLALQDENKKVVCLDGDGAMLMHMGAIPVIGQAHPENFYHVILNNGSHESVGGMRTAARNMDLLALFLASGYEEARVARTKEEITTALSRIPKGPAALEIKIALGSRENLGRPVEAPQESKKIFMAAWEEE